MKLFFLLTAFIASALGAFAQGTAFTYQGRLYDNGGSANGSYDVRFALYDAATSGTQQGVARTNTATGVTNGIFTVTLDFGNQFPGTARWVEVAVRTNGAGAFTSLAPRQPLTAAPYAITASNLTGNLPATQVSGALANANLPSSPTVSGTLTAGNFAGNGASVTGVNAASVNGLNASYFWQLGGNNVSATQFLGSTNNQPVELKVNNVRALRLEPNTNGAPNMVGGSPVNRVTAGVVGASIAGGGATAHPVTGPATNQVASDFGTIGGGAANAIAGTAAFTAIGGGYFNTIETGAENATVAGGVANRIQAGSTSATIAGGDQNIVAAKWGGVAAGALNEVRTNSNFAIVGGGKFNVIDINAGFTTIAGGVGNQVQSAQAVISGGRVNEILANSAYSVIAGGSDNHIESASPGSVISGGDQNRIGTNSYSAGIGSGQLNTIKYNAANAFIGGGTGHVIESGATYASILGGGGNLINVDATLATILSGDGNLASGQAAVIGNGVQNEIMTNSNFGVILNGKLNTITNAAYATIGNGVLNSVNALHGFIGAGANNSVATGAADAFIGGGEYNTATGKFAVVPGGSNNLAAANSFAAGTRAKAAHSGSFVWADTQAADFTTTAANQFIIRAAGGLGVAVNNPAYIADIGGRMRVRNDANTAGIWFYTASAASDRAFVGMADAAGTGLVGLWGNAGAGWGLVMNVTNGNVNIGNGTANPTNKLQVVSAYCTGTTWVNSSDRDLKQGFSPVNTLDVLEKVAALPITSWTYKTQPGEQHLGPVAQDFRAAFGLGDSDRAISTVDADGVALAAIQGLHQKLKQKDAELAELKGRLEKLERLLTSEPATK